MSKCFFVYRHNLPILRIVGYGNLKERILPLHWFRGQSISKTINTKKVTKENVVNDPHVRSLVGKFYVEPQMTNWTTNIGFFSDDRQAESNTHVSI